MNVPSTMRAAVYSGVECVEIRHIPVPEPGAGELLVRVRAATTCGTDVKIFRRGHPKFPPPFIFGHEFGGDVAATGSGVQGFKAGMRVTANVFAECGECFYCLHNQGNLCENLEYNFGAFAEYMLIPASITRRAVFEIPPHVSYAQAALLEPLVTVVRGQNLAAIQPGETVAILGAGGPIGLMHQQLALLAGAKRVIAIGHSRTRLEAAALMGANPVINAKEEQPQPIVNGLTNGRGADVVIECAGTKVAWESAVQMARRGGRVLWFGGLPSGTQVEIDATRVHYGAINLLNSHGGSVADAQQAWRLITSEQINLQPLLSGELPLERITEALQRMISGQAIKMIINPDATEES